MLDSYKESLLLLIMFMFYFLGLVDVSNIIASCPAQDVPENIYVSHKLC